MARDNDVVELLEAYLEAAKKHDFGHLAITMVGYPNIAAVDYVGDIALELAQLEAVGKLTEKLKTSIDNWMLPPRDASLDASHVCYNVANGPLGFDFVTWLVTAEMRRRRLGAPAPLKVGFWLGKDAQDRTNRDQRKMWLERVFRPALGLIGAVEDSTALGRWDECYTTAEIVAAAKNGEAVPRLKAQRPFTLEAVTITLREADHWPHRNSHLGEWLRFATYLQDQGEWVVFVRDTAKANEPLPEGFQTCPMASVDLDARMALYEKAKANLFVSNGPAFLALFSDRPWLQFVAVEDADNPKFAANTAKFWAESMGVPVGGQFPWSAHDQRMVWASPTFENIVAAWEGLRAVPDRDRSAA